jgi:hypothetical protein
MKRNTIVCSLLLFGLTIAAPALGQNCEFNIVGTWKKATADEANSVLYRFAPDGTVTVLSRSGSGPSSEMREVATATYKLDYFIQPDVDNIPKSISFKPIREYEKFADGMTSMEILRYDDGSFICMKRGSWPDRWIRVDPNRYFIILAARLGTFYDTAGPAFPMLIKMTGETAQVDAVGVYSVNGKRAFGPVPPQAYKEFMKEPISSSDTMLRLEITAAQYERGLKILKHWERRVREGALLYPKRGSLDNVVLVKQVTESLTQCDQKIKLHPLTYELHEDWISDKYGAPFIPFHYFKELRRLNESLHVRDDAFPKSFQPEAFSTRGAKSGGL